MAPKRQNASIEGPNSTPGAPPSLKKRLTEDDSVPSSSAKRRRGTPHAFSEGTPVSQRATRSATRGVREIGTHRTLEDEFKDIEAGALKEAQNEEEVETTAEQAQDGSKVKEGTPPIGMADLKSPSSEDNRARAEAQIQEEMGAALGVIQTPHKTPSKRGGKNTKGRNLEDEVAVKTTVSGDKQILSATKTTGTRIRFDSDEPLERPISDAQNGETNRKASEVLEEQQEEDEDDSDDEAPEPITQTSALAQAKATAAATAKAVERSAILTIIPLLNIVELIGYTVKKRK